jgi:hypothetical protein
MRTLLCALTLGAVAAAGAAEPKPKKIGDKDRQAMIDALEPFNALISEWRANGFVPGTDRNKTGWEESSIWVWSLKGEVAVKFAAKGAKVLSKGTLTYDLAEDKYVLKAVRADNQEVTYTGEFEDDKKRKFILTAELPSTKEIEKITINIKDEISTLTIVDRNKPGRDPKAVAEIVGVKKGAKISGSTESGPKCVVTGGPGTSSVSHGGKSYYVCCTGCRDAFNEDPTKWIAAAKKKGYIE